MDHQSWVSKATENLAAAHLCFDHSHKQEELIEEFVREIETKFPDVRFVEVNQSPESDNTLWLEFTKPESDDRLVEIIEYASNRTMDILLDYGYHMLVMPFVENGQLMSTS